MRTLLLAVLSLSTPAFAGTYIVDAAGGGDFTDIAPAIAFASPGDVLLIQPGTYGSFTLDKRLVIVGQGTAPKKVKYAGGYVRVQNVNTGNCAVIADLEFDTDVLVENCTRPVVFDRVQANAGFGVDGSSDVRSYGSQFTGVVGGIWPSGDYAFEIRGSRVELVESTVFGVSGDDIYEWGTPGDGSSGLLAQASRLHLARSSVYGGNGGIDLAGSQPGGDPGEALGFDAAAEVVCYGTSTDKLSGGSGENGASFSLAGQGPVRHSAVSLKPPVSAPQLQTAVPDDPSLYVLGIPKPGVTTTFRVAAPPGSLVELRMGRNPIVSDVPGLAEDVLVTPQRKFDLGQVGGSGVVGFNFPTPGAFPKGFTFFAQAKVTIAPGDERYTNSVPIVLR